MKKLTAIVLAAVCAALMFGCRGGEENIRAEDVTYRPQEILQPIKNPNMGWTAYSFKPYTDTTAVFGGQMSRYSTNLYSNYFSWRELEPAEGVYDFSAIDNFLELWQDYDLDMCIGIHMADATSLPGQIHVPQYIYEQVGGKWVTQLYGGAFTLPYPTWEPYYWEDKLLEAWGNLLKAFAVEYARNELWQEKIAQFDMSAYGQWGEWHTSMFDDAECRNDPKSKLYKKSEEEIRQIQVETMERMSRQYTDIFLDEGAKVKYPRLTVNVVYSTVTSGQYVAAEDGTLAPGIKSVIENAQTGQIDMFRRFIGGEHYLYGPDKAAILENWQRLRFHGEWGSATGGIEDGDFGNNVVGNPTTTQQAVQMGLDYHSSTLGWYVGSVLENKKVNISEVPSGDLYMGKDFIVWSGMTLEEYYQVNCGYRLVPESVTYPSAAGSGDTFTLSQVWAQKGCATVYDKYSLKAYLLSDTGEEYVLGTDEAFDARGWVKKEGTEYKKYSVSSQFSVPQIDPGWYKLMIALVDDTGEPAVNLAVAGKDTDGAHYGKYGLGYVAVNAPKGERPAFRAEGYSAPEKLRTDRPSVQSGYSGFDFGEEDTQFTGYAGFSFMPRADMRIWELGYAVKEAANSYPVTLSIVDIADKKRLVSRVFRFSGIGAVEYGQLGAPVDLKAGKEYAVLARYDEEHPNLYGERHKIKILYWASGISEVSEDIAGIRAVTSSDGLSIVYTPGGSGRSNGVLNFKYQLL